MLRTFPYGLQPRPRVCHAVIGLILSGAVLSSAVSAEVPDPADAQFASVSAVRQLTLRDLGAQQPLRLRGAESSVDLPVSIRNDELVTSARLYLRYAHAPAPIAHDASLTVLVNGEVISSLPLRAQTAEGGEAVIDIDPRALVGDSRLGMRMDMAREPRCDAAPSTQPWTVIGNDSRLELLLQRLPLASDLGLLPEPFFDRRDRSPLVLPVVLAADPSREELQAAGIVASWFGALAEHRGARFPVHFGKPPARGHAIFIGTRGRPGALPPGAQSGAELRIADHPLDAYAKLLVVTGDDGRELIASARALVRGDKALSGPRAVIRDLREPEPRRAYDAPRWVPTDRPVRLRERIPAEQLQVVGYRPSAIRLPWNLPPDLFDWNSKGARFDLGVRYASADALPPSLDLDVNNRFVRSLPLRAPANRADMPAPLESADPLALRERFHVPAYYFASSNELKWQFRFEEPRQNGCADPLAGSPRGWIDPDSTIDLQRLPHYTELPDLRLFADGAFPFSKYADLAQTVAVLSQKPGAAEIETFLQVLGHIGNSTGLAASGLRVLDAAALKDAAVDADLLVFGTPPTQTLLRDWAVRMPLTIDEEGGQLQIATAMDRLRARFEGRDLDAARDHAVRVLNQAGASLGAILSFESPLAAGRTVVVFTAAQEAMLPELSGSLVDARRRPSIGGDLSLVNHRKISNYGMAPRYSSGQLPLMLGLRWWLSRQPLVLALITILLSTLMALSLFVSMRKKAHARRQGGRSP